MLVALVFNGKVSDVLDLTSEQLDAAGLIYGSVIDVSSATPTPAQGWTMDQNGSLNPPGWRVTRLAMRQRFTVTELLGIMTYVVNNPASIVAMLMQNLQVATFVDLQRSDTIAGITLLANAPFNLITTERATTILTTPPNSQEIYTGT
jgi:hypothetical protein